MNGKAFVGLLFAGVGIAAIWYTSRRYQTVLSGGSDEFFDASHFTGSRSIPGISDAVEAIEASIVSWVTPAKGKVYQAAFDAATAAYGLPAGLLSRVAYQESRYNPNAKSPAGALGLMQFMPATAKDFGLNPLDPEASIWAAAKYLKQLYNKFGNWKEALAAYNWGQGNVAKKGLEKAPTETRNYFGSILADLGLTS
jgi:hypothetical protein